MTALAGPLAGMTVLEARAAAIEHLESTGNIANVVEKDQEVPVSERGKNPVEIILLKEWYVRQTHMQDRLRELVEEVEFHPPRNRQFLLDWMDNISIDWPISRRRWYHTEIPVWYADSGSKVIVPPKELTCNLGAKTHPPEAASLTGMTEPSSERGTTSLLNSATSLARRRCSTRGWIPRIPICS